MPYFRRSNYGRRPSPGRSRSFTGRRRYGRSRYGRSAPSRRSYGRRYGGYGPRTSRRYIYAGRRY